MASLQQFLHHSRDPFESPAKIFAKLKSKVQRGVADDVLEGERRAAEFYGGMMTRTPRRKTAEDALQPEMFGNGEVTALTLSPISSPLKKHAIRPEGERLPCTGTEHVLMIAHMPRQQRPFMESTAVCNATTRQSHMDGFHTGARVADRLVNRDPGVLKEAPESVFSPVRKRLRKRKLEEQLNKASSVLPDMDYVHSQEKERAFGRAFGEDDHYTCMRDVALKLSGQSHIKGCVVETPSQPATPAKIFAYLKEKENQRDQCNLQKVTSRTRPDAEWSEPQEPAFNHFSCNNLPTVDHQSEVMEEPDCAVSPIHTPLSPDLDKDIPHDPVSTVPPHPVVLEDPLVLNSPRVSIPKTQQAVFKHNKWPQYTTFPTENVIHLSNWFIRRNHKGLLVDGIHREKKIGWNSNVIAERVSKTVLKTITGKVYILDGKMDLNAPSEFPKWFLKSFANGFPSKWKEIYENYVSESMSLKRGAKKQSEERCQKPRTAPVDQSQPQKQQQKQQKKQQQQQQKSVVTSASSSSSTTPNILVSRSGRIIKPPLDYWRGGRVIVDALMNVTIHDGYDTVIQPEFTASFITKSSVPTMPAKKTALVKVPVNDDREQQEPILQGQLKRKVKASQRKPHKTKGNIIEKPPSPANHSPTTRVTRSNQKCLATEKTSDEAQPQESKKTIKEQRVTKAKPVKGGQQLDPRRRSPPVNTNCLSQPPTRRQEKENIKKTGAKRTDNKRQTNRPHRSSGSSHSSQERETPAHTSQKKQSKISPKPRSKTSSPKSTSIPTQTSSQPNRTRKRTAHSKRSPVPDEDAWTEAELRKLQEAVSCHPKHAAGYWTKVAMMVGTRSAEECHKQHTSQGASKTPPKRMRKPKEKSPLKEKVDNPVISARVGTLRRKQQVRDFLEAMPKEDMDDVFSSAYMRSKRFEVPSMCPSDDHDFSVSDQEPLTPKPTELLEAKTPQCLHITPGMMGSSGRNYDDKYVFQLQKRMKNQYQFNVQKHAPKNFSPTASVKKAMRRCGNTENDSFVVWEMFPDKEALIDSEEEEDFYFSEND